MTISDTLDALIEPSLWLGLIAMIWMISDVIFTNR